MLDVVSSTTLLAHFYMVVWFIKWFPTDDWLFDDVIVLGGVVYFLFSYSRNIFLHGNYVMMFGPFVFDTLGGINVFFHRPRMC